MAKNIRELIALGKDIAANRPSTNFNIVDMEATFRAEMTELIGDGTGRIDYHKWKKNNLEVFQIMSEILTEVEPKKMTRALEAFAEVKNFRHGDKARFTLRKGRKNVKRFVTRVAAAGRYERVRLDRAYVDVDTYAHGGAVYMTLEEFLSGRENLTEVLNLFMEALEEAVYEDILTALKGIAEMLPGNNKATGAFDATAFNRVLATVSAYGTPIILTSQAFAMAHLVPAEGWVSDAAREEMRQQGYLGMYNGARVVILEQTFEDATNEVKLINENIAYILPAGANEAPIKVALEGDVQVRGVEGEDWSQEMQVYRKLGIAIVDAPHLGICEITA